MIVSVALDIAIAMLALALLACIWRLLRGPDMADRVLALDTLYLNAVGVAILLGMRLDTTLLFQAALIIALLGFTSTAALARYLTRGDVIE